MSNTQFYFSLGVPFFTVLVVWIGSTIANRSAVNDLRSEMRAGFDSMGKRIDTLSERIDRLEARIDRLETRLDRLDTDIRKDHEHRLTILEERVLSRTA